MNVELEGCLKATTRCISPATGLRHRRAGVHAPQTRHNPHRSNFRSNRHLEKFRNTCSASAQAETTPTLRLAGALLSPAESFRCEGCWVTPPRGQPKAVLHFLGGAFVGSAPELTYPLLMRLLADGGYTVVATPYAVTFEHAECAIAVQQDFGRAVSSLRSQPDTAWCAAEQLPVFGVGHSNGALLHLLNGSLAGLAANHRGNVIISFNNREVTQAVPVPLSSLQPLLRAARQLPGASSADTERALQALAALAPGGLLTATNIESLLPVLDQLDLVLREVENGAGEFVPPPPESRQLIERSYAVPHTLLVQFKDDSIDETSEIEAALRLARLQGVQTLRLPGTHVTPCGAAAEVKIGRSFSPADAVALLLARAAEADVRRLAAQILLWLDRQAGAGSSISG